LKLDQKLKPLGMSQARWRTLLHLSLADHPITQSEIAAALGIEEPTLVTLLHRLERGGWVARKNAAHDRRCKTVHLGKRAHRIISEINATANALRYELLAGVSEAELKTCIRVLNRVREKAERPDKIARAKIATQRNENVSNRNGHNGHGSTYGKAARAANR
jgi:MarR family transcriptional regulator for hemolysin